MKTQTTDEAMTLLKAVRSTLISLARDVADELIRDEGRTTVVQVVDEMRRRGIAVDSVPRYWVGVIFRDPRYAPVPGRVQQGHRSEGSHAGQLVRVWTHAG